MDMNTIKETLEHLKGHSKESVRKCAEEIMVQLGIRCPTIRQEIEERGRALANTAKMKKAVSGLAWGAAVEAALVAYGFNPTGVDYRQTFPNTHSPTRKDLSEWGTGQVVAWAQLGCPPVDSLDLPLSELVELVS